MSGGVRNRLHMYMHVCFTYSEMGVHYVLLKIHLNRKCTTVYVYEEVNLSWIMFTDIAAIYKLSG